MKSLFFFGLSAVLLASCSKEEPLRQFPPVTEKSLQSGLEKPGREALSYASEKSRAIPSEARVFLVAGSMQNANFAQEVVDQIRAWRKAGFTDKDIACYYVLPRPAEFEADQAQYVSLAAELKNCYPASPSLIWKHLSAASKNPAADFVYLYVTGHGTRPLTERATAPGIGFPQKLALGKLAQAMPQLDQFFVELDALDDGTATDFKTRMSLMAQKTARAEDHLFAPAYLQAALAEFPPSIPKYVTVQSCYSGGFLHTELEKLKPGTLGHLSHVSVITSALHDRESFGCSAGTERTIFGQYYGARLERHIGLPKAMDWRSIYQETLADVALAEKEVEAKVSHKNPASEPQFFTNIE